VIKLRDNQKIYTIRKSVLNMPIRIWDKINNDFKTDTINLSVNYALDNYELISGDSCKWSDEEKEFFDEEYKELRRRRKNEGQI